MPDEDEWRLAFSQVVKIADLTETEEITLRVITTENGWWLEGRITYVDGSYTTVI